MIQERKAIFLAASISCHSLR